MISIGCIQRFDITVTRPLIDALKKCSETHYDGVCRSASMPGGFIYGWNNRMTFAEEDDEAARTFIDGLTNGKLQTCLKIFENPIPLTSEQTIARMQLSRLGYAALRQANTDNRFKHTIPVEQD